MGFRDRFQTRGRDRRAAVFADPVRTVRDALQRSVDPPKLFPLPFQKVQAYVLLGGVRAEVREVLRTGRKLSRSARGLVRQRFDSARQPPAAYPETFVKGVERSWGELKTGTYFRVGAHGRYYLWGMDDLIRVLCTTL